MPPRVAVVATTYFPFSHADVFITPLIEGYQYGSQHVEPRVEVVSMYLEQIDENDVGLDVCRRNGVPVFSTVAEAMAVGGTGVQVDGVVIIGEHGEYEDNIFGQKLYPRRRLVDSAISSMISAGKFVPIVDDKHLAWDYRDAKAIYDNCRRLGIPLLAGSSIPIAWHEPVGAEWPLDARMNEILVVGFGPTEIYGHHNLECLQAIAERRLGGETGVNSVRALNATAANLAIRTGDIDPELLESAIGSITADHVSAPILESVTGAFIVEYRDGLRATIVNAGTSINAWGVAATGPETTLACQVMVQPHPYSHAIFFVRQIESLIVNRSEPYPVERTLLTTGMLDSLMRSLHDGGITRHAPELGISYSPVEVVPDTGVLLPYPETAID